MGQPPAQEAAAARHGGVAALVGFAQGEQAGEEGPGVIAQRRGQLRQEGRSFFLLPLRIINRQAMLLLVGGNLFHRLHPPPEKGHQLLIDFVNLIAKIRQIHGLVPLFPLQVSGMPLVMPPRIPPWRLVLVRT